MAASIDQKEELKNKAVEEREAGNLKKALGLFEEVLKAHKEEKNLKGLIDVLGQIRITYTKLAEEESAPLEKAHLQKEAHRCALEAVEMAETGGRQLLGQLQISKVHLASTILTHSKTMEIEEKTKELENALLTLNEAIANLPGSKAHKAWPLNIKAKVLYDLDREEEAFSILLEAEKALYDGYDDEIKNADQAELKLNIWLAGIHLTRANICALEGKHVLAKHYASAILAIDDPKNTLGERKKEAKAILAQLSSQ